VDFPGIGDRHEAVFSQSRDDLVRQVLDVEWMLGLQEELDFHVRYKGHPKIEPAEPDTGIVRISVDAKYTGPVQPLLSSFKRLAEWRERREWDPRTSTLRVTIEPSNMAFRMASLFHVASTFQFHDEGEGARVTFTLDEMRMPPATHEVKSLVAGNITTFFEALTRTLGGQVIDPLEELDPVVVGDIAQDEHDLTGDVGRGTALRIASWDRRLAAELGEPGAAEAEVPVPADRSDAATILRATFEDDGVACTAPALDDLGPM
jgi:hypothetical protein